MFTAGYGTATAVLCVVLCCCSCCSPLRMGADAIKPGSTYCLCSQASRPPESYTTTLRRIVFTTTFFGHSCLMASDIYLGSIISIILPCWYTAPGNTMYETKVYPGMLRTRHQLLYIRTALLSSFSSSPRTLGATSTRHIPNSNIHTLRFRAAPERQKSLVRFRQGKPMLHIIHGRSFFSRTKLKHHRKKANQNHTQKRHAQKFPVQQRSEKTQHAAKKKNGALPPSISRTKRNESTN